MHLLVFHLDALLHLGLHILQPLSQHTLRSFNILFRLLLRSYLGGYPVFDEVGIIVEVRTATFR